MKELLDTKLDGASLDVAAQKRRELLELFPEARAEGDKIDFERLRLALGDSIETGKERYGLTWPGKAECFKTIQAPSMATLLPVPEKSVNFDTTENVIIEGDNLEVLKLLQKSYLGKIKMIYIDPPYNTGNDFIYPDNYSESLQTYLQYTGQVDAEGKKFGTNTDADGRFHSKWLNMMYPRLWLARNLLSEDGVIFITIDDAELDNLRKLCQEIFGEENFIAQIEWQKRYTRSNNTDDYTSVIDHVVLFQRSDSFRPRLNQRENMADARYSNPDEDPRGPWKAIPFLNPLSPRERPNLAYPIKHPSGRVIYPTKKAWRSSEAVWKRLVSEERIWWGRDGSSETPSIKRFLNEVRQGMTPVNFWDYEFAGHTDLANQEIKSLFGDKIFDTPKPSKLIRRMLQSCTDAESSDIVLDFFAGSGTTAHSVLDLNAQDGGNRRFILIQLPERTVHEDYPTIADMCEERVKRVIQKLNDAEADRPLVAGRKEQQRGFKVFKLAQSNVKEWDSGIAHDEETLEEQLALGVDHLRRGRRDLDIVYEVLLKSGYPLSTKIAAETIDGKKVYSASYGVFLVCLERKLTLELIKAIAERRPERVLFLDEGFAGNDQLKTNAVQTFKTKGITFRTL